MECFAGQAKLKMDSENLPFVTIVLPIYNRRGWVQEQLETLERQTYPRSRFEVIVVDNGSRDGAWEFAQQFAKSTPIQLTCYKNDDPVKVPAASRNLGIRHARGEFVGFTDSDCQTDKNWIREMVAAFREDVGIVEGRTIPVPQDPTPPMCRVKVIDGSRSLFDTCNIMYRKSALLEVGGFARDFYENGYPRHYGEDLDLGYRVKDRGWQVAFAPNAIVMHHNHPQTLMQWLQEPRLVYICPYIARKHPSARRELLFAKYFLSPSTAAFDAGLVVSVLAALVHPLFVLGWLPFLALKYREQGLGGNITSRFVRLGGGVVRSFVTFGVLATASIHYRSVIL
jgi:cellulose synthase/poly-beta-1,6-N-acetylglucosamine synthase-like glycosyltransferase